MNFHAEPDRCTHHGCTVIGRLPGHGQSLGQLADLSHLALELKAVRQLQCQQAFNRRRRGLHHQPAGRRVGLTLQVLGNPANAFEAIDTVFAAHPAAHGLVQRRQQLAGRDARRRLARSVDDGVQLHQPGIEDVSRDQIGLAQHPLTTRHPQLIDDRVENQQGILFAAAEKIEIVTQLHRGAEQCRNGRLAVANFRFIRGQGLHRHLHGIG